MESSRSSRAPRDHSAVQITGDAKSDNFVPFHRPEIGAQEERELLDTLRSGWLTTGPKTGQFETAFAEYVGARHAIGVNSATAALHLCLVASGVGPGDEVITSPLTFASTANVVEHVGASCKFVDVAADTLNLDPVALSDAVSERTRAIIAVHFAGHPCEMDEISESAQRHDLIVIHDSAHAIESTYKDARLGALDHASCYSFYATKNITTGEGGMVTTNDDELAHQIRVLRLHGISVDAWNRYAPGQYEHWDIVAPGFKYNMFDMQACLGIQQLKKIDGMWQRREHIVQRYDRAFADYPELILLKRRSEVCSAYHLYVVRFATEGLKADRDTILQILQERGVGIGIHFRPVHLHPYYKNKYGYRRGMYPVAEYAGDRVVSLPLFPSMTDAQIDHVISTVVEIVQELRM